MSNDVSLTNMGLPSQHEMEVFRTMAKGAVQSRMYKGDESSVIMIMLAARELGIPPMAALNGGLHLIQGKVEISARMMSALIRKAGHSLILKESTDEKCVLVGIRKDNQDTFEASYTIHDAHKAGLVKSGGGWVKFPKDMCFARALSRLSRQLFSDVIGIGYVEGEIVERTSEKQDKEDGDRSLTIQQLPKEVKVIEPDPIITEEMEAELLEMLLQDKEYKSKVEKFVSETLQDKPLGELSYKDFMRIYKSTKKHLENKYAVQSAA